MRPHFYSAAPPKERESTGWNNGEAITEGNPTSAERSQPMEGVAVAAEGEREGGSFFARAMMAPAGPEDRQALEKNGARMTRPPHSNDELCLDGSIAY